MLTRKLGILVMVLIGSLAWAQTPQYAGAVREQYAARFQALLLAGLTAQEAQADIRRLELLTRRGAEGVAILDRLRRLDRKRAVRTGGDAPSGSTRSLDPPGSGVGPIRGNRP